MKLLIMKRHQCRFLNVLHPESFLRNRLSLVVEIEIGLLINPPLSMGKKPKSAVERGNRESRFCVLTRRNVRSNSNSLRIDIEIDAHPICVG